MRYSSASGAAFRNRQALAHHAAQSGLRDAREMFGEDAVIGKLGGVIGPANRQEERAAGFFDARGGNFRRGNNEQGLKMGIEGPNVLDTYEEAHCSGCGVS